VIKGTKGSLSDIIKDLISVVLPFVPDDLAGSTEEQGWIDGPLAGQIDNLR
jgi:hypothetical protein